MTHLTKSQIYQEGNAFYNLLNSYNGTQFVYPVATTVPISIEYVQAHIGGPDLMINAFKSLEDNERAMVALETETTKHKSILSKWESGKWSLEKLIEILSKRSGKNPTLEFAISYDEYTGDDQDDEEFVDEDPFFESSLIFKFAYNRRENTLNVTMSAGWSQI